MEDLINLWLVVKSEIDVDFKIFEQVDVFDYKDIHCDMEGEGEIEAKGGGPILVIFGPRAT